jgi:hypothetical protein
MWQLLPLFSSLLARQVVRGPAQRLRSTRMVDYALARQRPELNIMKREKCTEADLDERPAEEPDVFERKAGQPFKHGGIGIARVVSSVLVLWGLRCAAVSRSLTCSQGIVGLATRGADQMERHETQDHSFPLVHQEIACEQDLNCWLYRSP